MTKNFYHKSDKSKDDPKSNSKVCKTSMNKYSLLQTLMYSFFLYHFCPFVVKNMFFEFLSCSEKISFNLSSKEKVFSTMTRLFLIFFTP